MENRDNYYNVEIVQMNTPNSLKWKHCKVELLLVAPIIIFISIENVNSLLASERDLKKQRHIKVSRFC